MTRLGSRLRRGLAAAGAWVGLLTACQARPRAPVRGPVVAKQRDETERESVAVTVYNQTFGVVKDTRSVKLARGVVELSFKDVSANIQPETYRVRLRYC